MDEPKYPNITVKLVGEDGNAFTIVGIVKKALKENGVPKEEINKFIEQALEGDYNKVLITCIKWVNIEWLSKKLPNTIISGL